LGVTASAGHSQESGVTPRESEELLKGYERPTDLTGPGGIIDELHKRLYEWVLEAELTHDLSYGKGEAPERAEGQRRENYRNQRQENAHQRGWKTRDRYGAGSNRKFEPRFIRKGE
jgi:hypothetical protein